MADFKLQQYLAQTNSQPTQVLTNSMGDSLVPIIYEAPILRLLLAPYPINVLKITIDNSLETIILNQIKDGSGSDNILISTVAQSMGLLCDKDKLDSNEFLYRLPSIIPTANGTIIIKFTGTGRINVTQINIDWNKLKPNQGASRVRVGTPGVLDLTQGDVILTIQNISDYGAKISENEFYLNFEQYQ